MSGGKDSTAVALLALERRKSHSDMDLVFVFADTDHETGTTYEYLDYLEVKLNIEIVRVRAVNTENQWKLGRNRVIKRCIENKTPIKEIVEKLAIMKPSGNNFLDKALWKGILPSVVNRYCTEKLKIDPINEQIIRPLKKQGYKIAQWLGVRKDESSARQRTTLFNKRKGVYYYHPIRNWTEKQVFDYISSMGLKRNPMYDQGFTRVGCAPCVFARMKEKELMAELYPECIDRVAGWEKTITKIKSNGKTAGFFAAPTKEWREICRETGVQPTIYEIVNYAKGGRGKSRQYEIEEWLEIMENDDCSSQGYCG